MKKYMLVRVFWRVFGQQESIKFSTIFLLKFTSENPSLNKFTDIG